jgi:hypothetical protein
MVQSVPKVGWRLSLSDGAVEALKWLGLVLMTLDHVNKYLLQGQVAWMFAAGRVVMPLFSVVLAWNLARPASLASAGQVAWRTARRLAVFGLIATPVSWALIGPWPLNILFMLACAAGAIALLQRGRPLRALAVGLVGGFLVEFWWPAIGMTVAGWCFLRQPSWRAGLGWCTGMVLVGLINGSQWGWACLPLVGLTGWLGSRLVLLRAKWWFYAYYPVHLAGLWVWRVVLY